MAETVASFRPPSQAGAYQTAQAPFCPSASRSPVAKLAGLVASHAHLALALIIVLIVVVVGLLVYYRGVWFLGPYAAGRAGKGKPAATSAGGETDDETERLIDAINSGGAGAPDEGGKAAPPPRARRGA